MYNTININVVYMPFTLFWSRHCLCDTCRLFDTYIMPFTFVLVVSLAMRYELQELNIYITQSIAM
jgi:hypothetical protein